MPCCNKRKLYVFCPGWFFCCKQIDNSLEMLFGINGTCTAFLQCGYLYEFSDNSSGRMLCDKLRTCMVFLQYVFSCGNSNDPSLQMLCDINCTCMVFVLYGFLYGNPAETSL